MQAMQVFQILTTLIVVFAAGLLRGRPLRSAVLGGVALATAPWPLLVMLALLPCCLRGGDRTVNQRGIGYYLVMLSVPAASCLIPGFAEGFLQRCFVPEVVNGAFNLYSVLGLNGLAASDPLLHVVLLIIGTATLFILGMRIRDPLQAGAFAALAGSLLLPGQTAAAGAAALAVAAVAAMRDHRWARIAGALTLVIASEVYVLERWSRYVEYFYQDFTYNLTRSVQPVTVAFFLIKTVLLVSMISRSPVYDSIWSMRLPPVRSIAERMAAVVQNLPPLPRITRRDCALLAGMVLLSLGMTFWRLGSFDVPKSGAGGKLEATVDFPDGEALSHLWIYKTRDVARVTIRCTDEELNQEAQFVDIESHGWIFRKLAAPCLKKAFLKAETAAGGQMIEVMLGDAEGRRILPLRVTGSGRILFDEQHLFAGIPTQFDGVYYDEGFHIDDGIKSMDGGGRMVEPAAHPFFGRATIATAMRLAGAVPFVWRLPDALAGALLPLLVFVLTFSMFRRKDAAFLAAALVLFDNARLALSRVATTDSQLVFLIVLQALALWQWSLVSIRDSKNSWGWLVICGLALGFAAGIKWSGIFALPVLGAMIFVACRGQFSRLIAGGAVLGGAACAAYLASYAIYFRQFDPDLVAYVLRDSARMLAFHRSFGGYIPYQSQFVEWPWINRPVALFTGYGLPPGQSLKVFIAGNPVVWWAVAPVTFFAVTSRRYLSVPGVWIAAGFLLVMYCAWGLIGRLTYLYHFAPMVPFGAILIAAVICDSSRRAAVVRWLYPVAAGAVFLVFFVNTAGLVVPAGIAEIADWFPGWFGLFDFYTTFSIAK